MSSTPNVVSIPDALAAVERQYPGSYWLLGKGKTHPDEPLFGFQVLWGADIVLAEGEGDDEVSAIRAALAAPQAA